MDKRIISVFQSNEGEPQVVQSMKDITSLAGVMSELFVQEFSTPINVLRILRLLNIVTEEALGLAEPIEDESVIFFRYQRLFQFDQELTNEHVNRFVFVLTKYNWISKSTKRIKMRDVGKRMMDMLIRLANDSLAYYYNDEIARSLFQAKRDAEISEAYDDKGISGGNRLASMIRNLEDAVELLKERELEFLADRNALPQVQLINEMMTELDSKLQERLETFQTVEKSLILTSLYQRGTNVLAEGTNRSLGTINKILNFATLQQAQYIQTIVPEKFRQYIIQSYDSPIDSEIADAHQILSFMEQNRYDDEAMDGLWVPIKMASPINPSLINETINFVENYEPYTEPIEEVLEDFCEAPIEVNEEELSALMEETKWNVTKEMIQTDSIEDYLDCVGESELEELILCTGSNDWSHAINSLLGVSAIVNMKRGELDCDRAFIEKENRQELGWKWVEREQSQYIIRRKSNRETNE